MKQYCNYALSSFENREIIALYAAMWFFLSFVFSAAVVSNKSKKTRNDSIRHRQPDVFLYLFVWLVVGLI